MAEVLAYYIPGVDHALDVMASPATLVAGAVASAAVMTDLPPSVVWPVAIIGGSGIAGLTKGSSALIRAKSGLMTGGLGNPVVATGETIGATGLSLFAIALPLVALVLVVVLLAWVVRKTGRFLFGRRKTEVTVTPQSADGSMCLLVLAWKSHPRYRLIVAANRDEFHDRPSAPLGWWNDEPRILAGRDLRGSGTWMGAARSGRFGIVTNFRELERPRRTRLRVATS